MAGGLGRSAARLAEGPELVGVRRVAGNHRRVLPSCRQAHTGGRVFNQPILLENKDSISSETPVG